MTDVRRLIGADGREVCGRCTVADTPLRRMRGLLGRSELLPEEALLLRPAPSVHTFFMRFPIDVVFLDRDLTVLRVAHAVRPWRAVSCRRARSVLELAAGEAARRSIREGETLRFEECPPVAQHGRKRPTVMVATADAPFVNIASFMLGRAGFDVQSESHAAPLAEIVAQRRPDVVVLDATESGARLERSMVELAARHPDVGVVVVAETAATAPAALRAVPKWGTYERLEAEIERAFRRARVRPAPTRLA